MTVGKNEIWAIVGCGMGGKGLIGDLGLTGFRLRACDRDESQIAGIRAAGGLHVDGRATDFAPVELVTTEIGKAVKGARVIIVSTYGEDHPQVACDLAPYLKDGQIVVLCQGNFGGTLVFRQALAKAGCKAKIDLGEIESYPYMMTVKAPDRVEFTTNKQLYHFVTHPASRTPAVMAEIGYAFPGMAAGANLLQTCYSTMAGVFHAGGLVTNVGHAEGGRPYNFYAANMTPSVCNMLEAMDRERVAAAKAYGFDVLDVFEWLEALYGRRERSLHWALQANAVTHYKFSPAPNSLGHRFLTTDVGCVLVPMVELGRVAGVPMPVSESVARLAGALTRRDFFKEGRNLRVLGLDGKSVAEIVAYCAG